MITPRGGRKTLEGGATFGSPRPRLLPRWAVSHHRAPQARARAARTARTPRRCPSGTRRARRAACRACAASWRAPGRPAAPGSQRRGRRRPALAPHELRRLRCPLHGPRSPAGRGRRRADDDRGAQPLPLRAEARHEVAQDAGAAARAALCAVGANEGVVDGVAPECLRCDGLRVHAPTVRCRRPSRNRPDRLGLTGQVRRGTRRSSPGPRSA